MAKYILTKRAEKDIQAIFEYGVIQFGVIQATTYLDQLENKLDLLALNPKLSSIREELKHQIRACAYRSHVILYKEFKDTVLILTIRNANENWLN